MMYSVLGSRRLTDEVLTTTVAIVEQVLNARPLTAVSADLEDLEALTPNHFLLGRASVSLPTFPTLEKDVDHRKAFRQSEAYADWIWSRWLKEYVPTLNSRSKWQKQTSNLAVGSLVWILEPSSRRSQYLLGRVVEVFVGDDGIVRSAKVRTSTGVYTRPAVKLVSLDDVCPDTSGHRAGNVMD